MISALPPDLDELIQQQISLRQSQLAHLRLLYNDATPSPKVLVAHGPDDTCILETLQSILPSSIAIDCSSTLSQRHLLSKIFARCFEQFNADLDRFDRIDSMNSLASNLKKLFSTQTNTQNQVLILQNADKQRGTTATLFPGIVRLTEYIPQLSIIFTSTSPRPLPLHTSSVLYIHFPPYTRQEALSLILQETPPLPRTADALSDLDNVKTIYAQFATVVYDTLVAPTTNSTTKFRDTLTKLWPRFIWPLITSPSSDWDFARLLSRNRALFQTDGEEALMERLIDPSSATTFEELQQTQIQTVVKDEEPVLLKYLPTILLLSCYLASHTHQKHDIVLFSRLSTASSTNRRKKKYLARSRAGGITKTPTKKKDMDEETSRKEGQTPKKERADRSMRAIFEKTSNVARPFTLERVIAILRAIHPDGIDGRGIADRVYVELGELERLRLVVRSEKSRGDEDIMEEKWKCIVGRDWVNDAGKKWGMGLEGWEVE